MLRLWLVARGLLSRWKDTPRLGSWGVDVLKSAHTVVLMDYLCRNVTRRDFTEQTIVGHLSSFLLPETLDLCASSAKFLH